MNDAALDRLRAVNPIPTDPGAPPIEEVRTRIAAGEPVPAQRTWRRWSPGAVAPALGAIAVAAVVAGVVVTIHVSSRPASAPTPAGGMLGQLDPFASGLDGDSGWVWFTRCTSCAGHPGRTSDWLATTSDGGRSWTTQRTHELLIPPASGADHDLWASALGNDAAGLGGGGVIVTHDGGRRWQLAHATPSPNPYSVSVARGEVWAVGDGCRGGCEGSVLRGRSTGSTLSRTPRTPPTDKRVRQIVAVSATSAYLYVPRSAAVRRRGSSRTPGVAGAGSPRAVGPIRSADRARARSGVRAGRAPATRRLASPPTAAAIGSTARPRSRPASCIPRLPGSPGRRSRPARPCARPTAAAVGTPCGRRRVTAAKWRCRCSLRPRPPKRCR